MRIPILRSVLFPTGFSGICHDIARGLADGYGRHLVTTDLFQQGMHALVCGSSHLQSNPAVHQSVTAELWVAGIGIGEKNRNSGVKHKSHEFNTVLS